MSRHRAVGRHAGHLRLVGARQYTPQHAAGEAAPAADLPAAPVRPLAALVAVPAPGLDLRPYVARPRGPWPYEPAVPTQPWAITPGAAA